MDLIKAAAKRILKGTGEGAIPLLEAVVAAAGACPPLQSAAGSALHIAKLVKVQEAFFC
jgi:hypothetical protein